MQIRMRDAGGVLRTISRIRMRDAGNVLRTLSRVRMRDAAGTLRTVWQYFTATIPSTEHAVASGLASSGTVTSSSIAVTVTGGTAPYTYLWQYVSGSLAIAITTPTGSASTFSAIAVDGVPEVAVFKSTVTDNNGTVIDTNTITVQLNWIDNR
jgi:hypothetical protein